MHCKHFSKTITQYIIFITRDVLRAACVKKWVGYLFFHHVFIFHLRSHKW